jgi:hypothetical protein
VVDQRRLGALRVGDGLGHHLTGQSINMVNCDGIV